MYGQLQVPIQLSVKGMYSKDRHIESFCVCLLQLLPLKKEDNLTFQLASFLVEYTFLARHCFSRRDQVSAIWGFFLPSIWTYFNCVFLLQSSLKIYRESQLEYIKIKEEILNSDAV